MRVFAIASLAVSTNMGGVVRVLSAAAVLLATAYSTVGATQASAEERNLDVQKGNELYELCTSASQSDRTECFFFVIGVAEAEDGRSYCPPPNVTNGQIEDIVRNGLSNHPEERQHLSVTLARKYLGAAWPCIPSVIHVAPQRRQ